jgi:hypothetical protein
MNKKYTVTHTNTYTKVFEVESETMEQAVDSVIDGGATLVSHYDNESYTAVESPKKIALERATLDEIGSGGIAAYAQTQGQRQRRSDADQ